MIDKFQFDPVDGLQNATAYPDNPGNEEAFREQLQRPLNQVKDFVNSLVDAYAKTEAGKSGAEEIGSEAISGLMDPSNPLQPALTVRKQLQAAQKNIDDIIAGIIPDGSVDTEKIADGAVTPDKVSGGVGCNYIRNRIPTTGDNFNLGYKVGDTWTVPDMTLNNLIPHATAITPADWTLQNGSLAGSGSKGTLTCGNGLESATAKISIAPIPGHVYALFGALKVTSANAIASISLGADQKAAPVKDAAYNLCEIITAPAEFKIQIIAASAAALNGATVEFDKVCIVDMTADMVGVPFDRVGAIDYFSSHAAFISQEPEYAGMHWYCKGSGVWQSSSQLSDETKALYGVENVDDALKNIHPSLWLPSFLAFVDAVSDKTLDNGFGKGRHTQYVKYLGFSMAMYAEKDKVDASKDIGLYPNLLACHNLQEINSNPAAKEEIRSSRPLINLIESSPYAKSIISWSYLPILTLYDGGNENVSLTGGISAVSNGVSPAGSGTFAVVKNATNITFSASTSAPGGQFDVNGSGYIVTNNNINLRKYKKVQITYSFSGATSPSRVYSTMNAVYDTITEAMTKEGSSVMREHMIDKLKDVDVKPFRLNGGCGSQWGTGAGASNLTAVITKIQVIPE